MNNERHFGAVSQKGNKVFLHFKDTKAFRERLKELVDKNVVFTLEEKKNNRSLDQNALYWKWMTIAGEDIGHTKEEMHFVFKKLFLADKMPALSKDEFMEYLQGLDKELASTRKLNTKEMSQYMDKVFEQARELNIRLPLPPPKGLEQPCA